MGVCGIHCTVPRPISLGGGPSSVESDSIRRNGRVRPTRANRSVHYGANPLLVVVYS